MNGITIGIIVFVALCVLLGFAMGFGKSLKFLTKGIFGIAIAIVACVMFGGTIQSIDFIQKLIIQLNEKSDLFRHISLGVIVYYVVLFIVFQIIRKIIVAIICHIDSAENKVMKFFSKIFGAVLFGAFSIGLILLVVAALKTFENYDFANEILLKVQEGALEFIYSNNPINFKL